MDRFIWVGLAVLAIVAYLCLKWIELIRMRRPLLYGTIPPLYRTIPLLFKQYLDDVIDNSDYLPVDVSECFDCSTIDIIYVKYDFIDEVYSYFHQLQNKNEDGGCLGVGRWVRDSETKQYSISLEEVVLPGDDAAFNENVIEFGVKSKIKCRERLKRLRRETQLQYDITCWIHFKKKFGVSLDDEEKKIQDSLKLPSNPFLHIAIIVDASSPKGELGIYTYQHLGDSNSSNQENAYNSPRSMYGTEDLKKTFSLDEWHKWAIKPFQSNPFIVNLSIDGTEYEEVEVAVSNPEKTIRQQIESIIRVFDLPVKGYDGTPIDYFLAKMLISDNEEEPHVMEFEDEDGNEMTLMDYDVKSGDHIALMRLVLYGSAIIWPIPPNNPLPSSGKLVDE